MEQLVSRFKVFQSWDDSGGSSSKAPQFIKTLFEFWTPGFVLQSTDTSISETDRESIAPDSPCSVYLFMDSIKILRTSRTETAKEISVFISFSLCF